MRYMWKTYKKKFKTQQLVFAIISSGNEVGKKNIYSGDSKGEQNIFDDVCKKGLWPL